MAQNMNLGGAAEAIEKTKNGAAELSDQAENAFARVTDKAQSAYEKTMESALQTARETYDTVGDAFRAGEDYVRREPVWAVAIAGAVGLAIGYMFAVRSAPISSGRRSISRWQ